MAKTRTRARNYHVQIRDAATGEWWAAARTSPDPRYTWASKTRAFHEASALIHSQSTATTAQVRVLDVRTGQALCTWTRTDDGRVIRSEPKLLVQP